LWGHRRAVGKVDTKRGPHRDAQTALDKRKAIAPQQRDDREFVGIENLRDRHIARRVDRRAYGLRGIVQAQAAAAHDRGAVRIRRAQHRRPDAPAGERDQPLERCVNDRDRIR
jgi:hypothetical protein